MTQFIRAKAPLRIGIAGGGTDVNPYASQKGGCVFNTTIDKYAYCTVIPTGDGRMGLSSPNFSRYEIPRDYKTDLEDTRLAAVVAKHFEVSEGFEMVIHSDAPPGSGLGGSSTMIVAMIAAMSKWRSRDMTPHEIAELAYRLEREDLGLSGGKQDQFAAAYGGFNLMRFDGEGVTVERKYLDEDTLNELQYRSLLCYTGKSRKSAALIDKQIDAFKTGANANALDESKRLAVEICDAVAGGDLDDAGRLLDESWEYKKRFSKNVSTADTDKYYNLAKATGAIGGKVSGAGGGGFMYFICRYDKKHEVAKALKRAGAEITEFAFDPCGAVAWRGDA
ncbi:MAG: kinase [Candidatus Methanoplasma sp.]|jgi:D-glycero-alpha-D-manno-heptose-7-phosphate kinase|nr:kinase [Candidatus Methanoplasma sp.]